MMVSVVIPAYNEEKRIQATLKSVFLVDCVGEVIVVDDGSSDNTADLAEKAGAVVLKNKKNMGKGQALRSGLSMAKGDIIVFLDADVGEKAAEIKKLIRPVMTGEADMTIARFPPARKKGGFGFVKALARWGVYIYTGKNINCALSGQRVFRLEVMECIGNISPGFGVEVGLTIDALKKGFSVMEVDVDMTHRETGRDLGGFAHRIRQFFNILQVLIQRAVE